jgi:hypothetical protein
MIPLIPLATLRIGVAYNGPWNVDFTIRPDEYDFTGPCKVSTIFPVDVNLWNDFTLTEVGVYAYDFYVMWQNDSLSRTNLTLVGWTNHIPYPTGKYFLIINETGTIGGWNFFHEAVTAYGNGTADPTLELGQTAPFNASLVTLNFHIDDEPLYPDIWHADFLLNRQGFLPVLLSDGSTPVEITNVEIENGEYNYFSSQPNIDPHAELAPPYATSITVNAIGETETVYIHLTNITKAYSFNFNLEYNPAWKQTDVQHITILPAFSPPYESLDMSVDNETGIVHVSLKKPSEKPGVCGADVPIVKIDFVSTLTPEIGKVPYSTALFGETFRIVYANIDVKDGVDGTREYFLDPWHGAKFGAIMEAADRLVALQDLVDHGWDWDVTALTAHSGAASSTNLYGVIADELIHAIKANGDYLGDYMTAAQAAADFMTFGDPTVGDFYYGIPPYPATYHWGMRSLFDYTFLMDFAALSGDTSYSTYAKAAWTWQKANGGTLFSAGEGGIFRDRNQTTLWNHYKDLEIGANAYQIASWWASADGLAALKLGDKAWAEHMAAVLHANIAFILANPVNPNDAQTVIGAAETLKFFWTLGNASYAADCTALIARLIATQDGLGAWTDMGGIRDSQMTAYAIMALWLAGTTETETLELEPSSAARTAAMNGANFLLMSEVGPGMHRANGGFWQSNFPGVGYSEISEVDAEVLSALFIVNGDQIWYSGDLGNIYVPKSKADLNLDGVVDILDLAAIAKVYGKDSTYNYTKTTPPQFMHWSDLVTPFDKGGVHAPVDIYDVVYVAKHFGDP